MNSFLNIIQKYFLNDNTIYGYIGESTKIPNSLFLVQSYGLYMRITVKETFIF